MRNIGKPVIAAVSGYALGGGCELAMLCDMIVASETARFGQPEINVGLMPRRRRHPATGPDHRQGEGDGDGPDRRDDRRPEAERLGLVNRVVAPEVLLDEAKAIAFKLASKPPISVRLAKQAVNKAFEATIEVGLELERRSFFYLFASEDTHEGIQAFIEKRRPKYHNR